ncbi:hypothetical protein BVC80_9029g32 [Macleaya cordata]|uniref:Uncharacterized protein n=1 Tax=Macleaya cordata TaxID=56857 RepID=A0A200QUR5_MACCD|nr:hypothetical protein BVC80_9029g32 [Macleaya cordata]
MGSGGGGGGGGGVLVAKGMFGCVYEGCITMYEMEIERRPYHRNCGCALHKSRGSDCSKQTCVVGNSNYPYPNAN